MAELPLIQRFPSPLMPLLSIKSSDTPPRILQELAPSLEMLQFYIADRIETQSNSVAGVTTAFAQSNLTVPANEYWWLLATMASATVITVGSNVQLATGITMPEGNAMTFGAMTAPTVSIAGQGIDVPGQVPAGGMILRPGSKVFASTQVAPTSITLTVRATIARLAING